MALPLQMEWEQRSNMASGKVKSASKQYKAGATTGSVKKASAAKASKAGASKYSNMGRKNARGC